MALTVYAISGAPCSWRVLLGLTFKGLDYVIHYLEGSMGEHKSEAYLEINPRGKVPALVTDGSTLRDSIAILAWLDRAYPDRPLFGADAEQAAAVWQVTMESCDYLRDALDALLRPIFFEGATEATPELYQAAETMRAEFAWLEGLLEEREFLAGNGPTAADAVCFPEVRIMQRAIDTHTALMADLGFKNGLAAFPRLVGWKDRIEGIDGYVKTKPSHWNV